MIFLPKFSTRLESAQHSNHKHNPARKKATYHRRDRKTALNRLRRPIWIVVTRCLTPPMLHLRIWDFDVKDVPFIGIPVIVGFSGSLIPGMTRWYKRALTLLASYQCCLTSTTSIRISLLNLQRHLLAFSSWHPNSTAVVFRLTAFVWKPQRTIINRLQSCKERGNKRFSSLKNNICPIATTCTHIHLFLYLTRTSPFWLDSARGIVAHSFCPMQFQPWPCQY